MRVYVGDVYVENYIERKFFCVLKECINFIVEDYFDILYSMIYSVKVILLDWIEEFYSYILFYKIVLLNNVSVVF